MSIHLLRNLQTEEEFSQNIFQPPAHPAEIEQMEKTLEIKLPGDYKTFLMESNGFEGDIGESIVILEPVEKCIDFTQTTLAPFFPWAVFIGSNGSNETYVLDKRGTNVQFGMLPSVGGERDFIPLGNTFEAFLRKLRQGDFYT